MATDPEFLRGVRDRLRDEAGEYLEGAAADLDRLAERMAPMMAMAVATGDEVALQSLARTGRLMGELLRVRAADAAWDTFLREGTRVAQFALTTVVRLLLAGSIQLRSE